MSTRGNDTFSFDDSEFNQQPEDAAEAALASLEQSPPTEMDEDEEPAEDPELADVDTRLETADYYRAILRSGFFDEAVVASSPVASIVDREIRTFIRERLSVLVGLRQPKAAEVVLPFDGREVEVLKTLADLDEEGVEALKMLLGKVKALATKSREPRKRPAAPPARPVKVEPARRAVAVKRVVPPAPAPTTRAAPKTEPKPPVQAPAAPPKPPAKAPAKPQGAKKPTPKRPGAVTQIVEQVTKDGEVTKTTLVEGEIIEENGRRYKVARNEAGTLFRQDITGQVSSPSRLPPMSRQQQEMYQQQQAMEQVSHLSEVVATGVAASMINKAQSE